MYKVHRVVIGADDAPGAPIRCDFPVDCVGNLLEGHAGGRSGVRIECTDPESQRRLPQQGQNNCRLQYASYSTRSKRPLFVRAHLLILAVSARPAPPMPLLPV